MLAHAAAICYVSREAMEVRLRPAIHGGLETADPSADGSYTTVGRGRGFFVPWY
jgi:hypothetical protein